MKPNTTRTFTQAIRWCQRRLHRIRSSITRKKGPSGTLFYVGMHLGREFDVVFQNYSQCYGFEANPELFAKLVEKYRDYPHVKLFNNAATDTNGPVTFNISSNNGASSSLGQFDESWQNFKSGDIKMVRSVTVDGVNLHDFCVARSINFIDDYISDIQGMDLQVLRSLAPMIASKRIGSITVETTRDGRKNIYSDLPDNSESGFKSLLSKNYKLVAMGYGVLEDHWFADFDEGSWEIDCKWVLR